MNRKILYSCLLAVIVLICIVLWMTDRLQVAVDDEAITPGMMTTKKKATASSSYICGRVGTGPGMSCVEFITQAGDTLLLSKTSEFTGADALVIGSLQTDVDNLYAVRAIDDNSAIGAIVNLTELQTSWQHDGKGFLLSADSVALPVGKDAPKYRRWHLADDRIVMERIVQHEGGATEVADTLGIVSLTPDTLVLRNHFGEELKYWH